RCRDPARKISSDRRAGPGRRRQTGRHRLRGARRQARAPLLPAGGPRGGGRPAREGAQPDLPAPAAGFLSYPPRRRFYTGGVLLDHRRSRSFLMYRVVPWIPAAVWAAVLFLASSQVTLGVTLSGGQDKIAHFAAYLVLGFLL